MVPGPWQLATTFLVFALFGSVLAFIESPCENKLFCLRRSGPRDERLSSRRNTELASRESREDFERREYRDQLRRFSIENVWREDQAIEDSQNKRNEFFRSRVETNRDEPERNRLYERESRLTDRNAVLSHQSRNRNQIDRTDRKREERDQRRVRVEREESNDRRINDNNSRSEIYSERTGRLTAARDEIERAQRTRLSISREEPRESKYRIQAELNEKDHDRRENPQWVERRNSLSRYESQERRNRLTFDNSRDHRQRLSSRTNSNEQDRSANRMMSRRNTIHDNDNDSRREAESRVKTARGSFDKRAIEKRTETRREFEDRSGTYRNEQAKTESGESFRNFRDLGHARDGTSQLPERIIRNSRNGELRIRETRNNHNRNEVQRNEQRRNLDEDRYAVDSIRSRREYNRRQESREELNTRRESREELDTRREEDSNDRELRNRMESRSYDERNGISRMEQDGETDQQYDLRRVGGQASRDFREPVESRRKIMKRIESRRIIQNQGIPQQRQGQLERRERIELREFDANERLQSRNHQRRIDSRINSEESRENNVLRESKERTNTRDMNRQRESRERLEDGRRHEDRLASSERTINRESRREIEDRFDSRFNSRDGFSLRKTFNNQRDARDRWEVAENNRRERAEQDRKSSTTGPFISRERIDAREETSQRVQDNRRVTYVEDELKNRRMSNDRLNSRQARIQNDRRVSREEQEHGHRSDERLNSREGISSRTEHGQQGERLDVPERREQRERSLNERQSDNLHKLRTTIVSRRENYERRTDRNDFERRDSRARMESRRSTNGQTISRDYPEESRMVTAEFPDSREARLSQYRKTVDISGQEEIQPRVQGERRELRREIIARDTVRMDDNAQSDTERLNLRIMEHERIAKRELRLGDNDRTYMERNRERITPERRENTVRSNRMANDFEKISFNNKKSYSADHGAYFYLLQAILLASAVASLLKQGDVSTEKKVRNNWISSKLAALQPVF